MFDHSFNGNGEIDTFQGGCAPRGRRCCCFGVVKDLAGVGLGDDLFGGGVGSLLLAAGLDSKHIVKHYLVQGVADIEVIRKEKAGGFGLQVIISIRWDA